MISPIAWFCRAIAALMAAGLLGWAASHIG